MKKICPICKALKPLDDYHKYFSKSRGKMRIGNYCKPCAKMSANSRAKEHYAVNRESKLQYAKQYRANPANKEKLHILSQKFKIKYRTELKDCYIRDQLVQKSSLTTKDFHDHPEFVQAYRLKIFIKRKIKQHGKEQNC